MNKTDTIDKKSLVKPIQYLGAKDRAIKSIINYSKEYINGGYVLDLFSGSTIVSQAYALNDYKVISNDVQYFSRLLANTFLKVNYNASSTNHSFANQFLKTDRHENFPKYYSSFIDKEEKLINAKDTKNLIKLYQNFPLAWRKKVPNNKEIKKYIKSFNKNEGTTAFEKVPLCTLLYAGTYFGIKQSIDFDLIRWRIEDLFRKEEITSWQYNLFLTSLVSILSQIVNSVGKHFAQPVKFENILDSELLEKRLYKNRSYDVKNLFFETANSYLDSIKSNKISTQNISLDVSLERLLANDHQLPEIDLIYADPPYTAQQYSRFYHVPEILSKYMIPKLQIHRGEITRGIYHANKFKSRFCSIRKAPNAFRDLFRLTKNRGANLILSYSISKSEVTGNKRMISLEEIHNLYKEILKGYNMEIKDIDINYKQLNKKESIKHNSKDSEVLLIFSNGH